MFRAANITSTLVMMGAVVASLTYFGVRSQPVSCSSTASESYTLPLSYHEARTQLVRGDFTPQIIAATGCEVTESEVLAQKVDLSRDPRPLINALRRKSKSTVKQTQTLVVQVPDEQLETRQLQLLQTAEITPEGFNINVKLTEPAGILTDYQYSVVGRPVGDDTQLEFTLKATVEKEISSVAHNWVRNKVQEGIEDTLRKQSTAFVQSFELHDE